jgi:glycosyltransferase involved in cell wall biosynthesis
MRRGDYMRIAMMTNNYKPFIGGVPISIERLAIELRKLGHEIYIFAPRYGEEVEEEYVIRYHSMKAKVRGEYIIPNVLDPVIGEKFSEISFDLIHVHHPMMIGYVAQYLGRRYNIPVILTYHTKYEQYLHYLKFFGKRPASEFEMERHVGIRAKTHRLAVSSSEKLVVAHNRSFMNKCSLVFAPSNSMKEYLLEQDTVTGVEVVPTGLLREEFEYNPSEVAQIREIYSDTKYLFCSVSRLEREKNIEFLLEGLKEFKARKGDCFKLLLIGEGGRRKLLENKSMELGLEQNIVFCGGIPHEQLRNYYRACDAFLFASTSETQGIVLLEAMAARLPTVAVKASGVCDVVVNGWNGYMTQQKVDSWTERLIELVDNERLTEAMRSNAFSGAKNYLSENIALKVQKHYQNVLSQRKLEPENEYRRVKLGLMKRWG